MEAAEVNIRELWKIVGVVQEALIEIWISNHDNGMALRTPNAQIGELFFFERHSYPQNTIFINISL